ncbi:MAG TPA: aromatic-ring-hydroxylating dioxygenase subunit beta [Acidimicrobiales bacterium]|jgi:p-cumate 2,3-dioxygenase beta subunit|nr:aromatic-ring-hydroxylating dioxygenase subunit beta [Acidimicrobiales bacterium]
MTAVSDSRTVTRADVEDFLYAEAALLDNWQLDEWVRLFTDDAHYVIPATDLPTGDPRADLVLIDDNLTRLQARVKRLNSRRAYREFPWSRTRRMVSNVRIAGGDGQVLHVEANFVVYRVRDGVNPYIGRYLYHLVPEDGGFRISYRRAELDLETLRPHGTVSIIV